MLIPVLRDRTSKPPMGVPLRSDGHWMGTASGFWSFNEGAGSVAINSVDSSKSIVTAPTWGAGGLVGSGAGYAKLIIPAYPTTSPWSVFCLLSNSSGRMFSLGQPNGNYILQILDNTIYLKTSTDSDIPYNITGKKNASVIVTCDGNTTKCHINGALVGSIVLSPAAASIVAAGVLCKWENNGPLSIGSGTVHCGGFIPKTLSSAEVASLSANPWQVFEPEVVWVEEVGAGAGGTTYQVLLDLSASSGFSNNNAANLATSLQLASSSGFSDSNTNQTNGFLNLSTTADLNNTCNVSYIVSMLLNASVEMSEDYLSNVGNLILGAVAGMQTSATKTAITDLVLSSISGFTESGSNTTSTSLNLDVTSDFSNSTYKLILASLELDVISGFDSSVSSIVSAIVTIAANSNFSDSANTNILANAAIQAVANFSTYNNIDGSAILSEIRMNAVLSKNINVIAVMNKVISIITKPK